MGDKQSHIPNHSILTDSFIRIPATVKEIIIPASQQLITKSGAVKASDLSTGDALALSTGSFQTIKSVKRAREQDTFLLRTSARQECLLGRDTTIQIKRSCKPQYRKFVPQKLVDEYGISEVVEGHTHNYWRLPTCQEPIRFPEKELPVDPFVLGAFIGNGCCTFDELVFSSNDKETVPLHNTILYSITHIIVANDSFWSHALAARFALYREMLPFQVMNDRK